MCYTLTVTTFSYTAPELVLDSAHQINEREAVQHSDEDYINHDPFFGDESELSCRTVSLRKARKEHLCFTIDGKQDHHIQVGERYRYEKALVDKSFWGEYRICLKCMDKFIALDDEDE